MSVSPLVIVVGSVGLVVGMGVGFVAARPSAAVTSSTQPSTSPAVQPASPPPCGEALGFPTDSDATGALRRMESRMGGSEPSFPSASVLWLAEKWKGLLSLHETRERQPASGRESCAWLPHIAAQHL